MLLNIQPKNYGHSALFVLILRCLVEKMSSVNKTVLIYLMGYKFSNSRMAVPPMTDEDKLEQ